MMDNDFPYRIHVDHLAVALSDVTRRRTALVPARCARCNASLTLYFRRGAPRNPLSHERPGFRFIGPNQPHMCSQGDTEAIQNFRQAEIELAAAHSKMLEAARLASRGVAALEDAVGHPENMTASDRDILEALVAAESLADIDGEKKA